MTAESINVAGDATGVDPHRDDRIFVEIAAYREPDCQNTVRELFDMARYPDRISVGICWQFVPEEDDDCFKITFPPEQVRTVEFHAEKSKGVQWARHETDKLWRGEEYRLQIDAHMRFVQDWDTKMFACLDQCPSSKPLLSIYPLGFRRPRDLDRDAIIGMQARRFNDYGILKFIGARRSMDLGNEPPVPNAFAAGGFLFGSTRTITEVPYDPNLYFGEEISMSVRLWTHGWDLFCPNEILIYHDYAGTPAPGERKRAKHWSDNRNWKKMHTGAMARVRHLLGMEVISDPELIKDLDKYPLGTERTLKDYEAFSGVNFRARTFTVNARKGRFGDHARPDGMGIADQVIPGTGNDPDHSKEKKPDPATQKSGRGSIGNKTADLGSSKKTSMSDASHKHVAEMVATAAPCQMLIFGPTVDHDIWMDLNAGGRVVILTDETASDSKDSDLRDDVFRVDYATTVGDWQNLLANYSSGGNPFKNHLPESMRDVAWDIILVKGPAGYSRTSPGRMESIFSAYEIANRHRAVDICVDDTDRVIESIYSSFFFGRDNLVASVDKLRHYRLGAARELDSPSNTLNPDTFDSVSLAKDDTISDTTSEKMASPDLARAALPEIRVAKPDLSVLKSVKGNSSARRWLDSPDLDAALAILPDLKKEGISSFKQKSVNLVFSSGNTVYKFAIGDGQAQMFQRERLLLNQLDGKLGVQTPLPLATGDDPVFVCYTKIDGTAASLVQQSRPDWNADVEGRFLKDAGRVLSILHGVEKSSILGVDERYGADLIEHRIMKRLYRVKKIDPSGVAHAFVKETFERGAEFFGRLTSKVLLHMDFVPSNILIDPKSGSITGLLDFSHSWFGDYHWDFKKIRMTMGEPGLLRLIEEYCANGGRPVDLELVEILERVDLCTSIVWTGKENTRLVEKIVWFMEHWRPIGR